MSFFCTVNQIGLTLHNKNRRAVVRRCFDSLELTRGPSALKQKFHHLFLFLLFLAMIVVNQFNKRIMCAQRESFEASSSLIQQVPTTTDGWGCPLIRPPQATLKGGSLRHSVSTATERWGCPSNRSKLPHRFINGFHQLPAIGGVVHRFDRHGPL